MLERGLKGSKLDEELKNAEKEAGILAGEETIKKETPVEDVTISTPTEQVKTTEQIAVEKEEKEEQMEEIKDQIVEKIDKVNQENSTAKSKIEKFGFIEGFTRVAMDKLISGAKNEEDKKVFTEILEKIDKIKQNIIDERKSFRDHTDEEPSLKNMQNFYKKNKVVKGSMERGLHVDLMDGFDENKSPLGGTEIVDLKKITDDQFKQIMDSFNFGKIKVAVGFPNKDSVLNAYNFNKGFFRTKVEKRDGTHDFVIRSETPGVLLKAKSTQYGDLMYISLGKQFVDEIFEKKLNS